MATVVEIFALRKFRPRLAGGTNVIERPIGARLNCRLTLRSATGFSQRENHHPSLNCIIHFVFR